MVFPAIGTFSLGGKRTLSDIEYMATIEEGVVIPGSQIQTKSGSTSGAATNIDIVVAAGKDGYLASAKITISSVNTGASSNWAATLQAPAGTTLSTVSGASMGGGAMSHEFSFKGKKLTTGQTFRIIISNGSGSSSSADMTIIEVPTGISPRLP